MADITGNAEYYFDAQFEEIVQEFNPEFEEYYETGATDLTGYATEKWVSDNYLPASELPNAVNNALEQAKNSGLFDGSPGSPGKTAYQYALDGGYTGTEAEFAELLANGSGGGSVQSDWNQFDATASDFIKNKTHWARYNSVKFDGEIELDDYGEGMSESLDLIDGQLYTVRYDGNIYALTALDLAAAGLPGYIAMGNMSELGFGGEEFPFVMLTIPGMYFMFSDFSGKTSTNVRLSIVEGSNIGDTVTLDDEISSVTYFVKVSDSLPTIEDLENGFSVTYIYKGVEYTEDHTTLQGANINGGIIIGSINYSCLIYIVTSTTASLPLGLYFIDLRRIGSDEVVTQSFTIYNSTIFAPKREGKKLDSQFLPGTVLLYADEEGFIYATSDTSDPSKRMTAAECVDIMMSGSPVFCALDDGRTKARFIPYAWGLQDGVFMVQSDAGQWFSAEFTG